MKWGTMSAKNQNLNARMIFQIGLDYNGERDKFFYIKKKKNIDISTVYNHHPESKINNFVDSKSEKKCREENKIHQKKNKLTFRDILY